MERIPGVACAELNFASATLFVDFDPGLVPVGEIVDTVTAAGYGAAPLGEKTATTPQSERRWIDRYLTEVATIGSGVFTALGLLTSWSGAPEAASAFLFAVAIVFGGLLVWRRAWLSLKAHTLDMNVLMTIAVFGAVLLGEWGEGATVYFLFSLGGLLEARSLERTRRSIRDLMSLAPSRVRVVRGGATIEIVADEAIIGDAFVVRPGERIALDGVVLSGRSAIDESAITGESVPAEKAPGDEVFAGTLNESGLLQVETTALATDSTLSRVVHLVEEAQASRAPSQTLIERFTRWYTPAVIVLAALVAVVPPLVGAATGIRRRVMGGVGEPRTGAPCRVVPLRARDLHSRIDRQRHHAGEPRRDPRERRRVSRSRSVCRRDCVRQDGDAHARSAPTGRPCQFRVHRREPRS